MKRTGALPALSLTISLVMVPIPVLAHHGRAGTYTGSKPITSKVTVIRFDYKNPHVRVYFETKDDAGNVKRWNGEMANISQFVRAGWTKARMVEQLEPGSVMTFTYLPAVSQTHSGEGQDSIVMKIVNANGDVIGLVRAGAAEALAP